MFGLCQHPTGGIDDEALPVSVPERLGGCRCNGPIGSDDVVSVFGRDFRESFGGPTSPPSDIYFTSSSQPSAFSRFRATSICSGFIIFRLRLFHP